MRFVFSTIWRKKVSYVSFRLNDLILPSNFEMTTTCDQGAASGTGRHCGKRKLNEHFTTMPYESKNLAKTLQKFVEAQGDLGSSEKILDANILKTVPEAVKNFFLLFVKEVNVINELYECLGLLLENNKSLFNDNKIIAQVQKVSNNGKRSLQMLTDSIIEKLENSYQSTSNDSFSLFEPLTVKLQRIDSFESSVDTKPTFEDDDIDLAGSDIELQLEEIVDKTSKDKSASAQSSIFRVNNDTSVGQETLSAGNDKNSCNFNYDSDGYVKVFIDGSCLSNGRSNAKAGIGVWFNDKHPLNVSKPVTGLPTNNNAEIQAATQAILKASSVGVKKLRLYTDSQFVINCMTKWIFKWKRRNWINSSDKPVINKISLMELDKVLPLMDAVDWKYVEGHKGILGNERADFLAREGARKM